MNNKILAARKLSSLVCVWRSTEQPGMPLVCGWVLADTRRPHATSSYSSKDEGGGLRQAA